MYLKAEFASSIVWLGSMFALGLYFSRRALAFNTSFRSFSLMVLLFIIGFMILQKFINLIIEIAEEWGIDNE